ncbi:GTP-binding protein 2 [Ascosphaera apis ARSEF 7405]|uniref:GTP-binding protein 2 n=1 Tax=Ascosphaera apis ARSEF 7405 TaxID=392613 RepID=A0A167WJF4_9EURO|nr:GTP-binding protein 2 [Ascosphaera apis ARSEF 7405]
MASIFTFDTEMPRVCSPWDTRSISHQSVTRGSSSSDTADSSPLENADVPRLEPEPQDGPIEYKLHLLLRPRRSFVHLSTEDSYDASMHQHTVAGNGTRRMQSSSTQSRQNRLEHLTTQLLWRLQQSSPFHSSSARNLVVPVLPDTSTKLGVPKTLAPLLPGLEESQGALYEIGVSDDGTCIGLTDSEMSESLTNLTAMAASLGCKVEVLRKVVVGDCRWENVSVDGERSTVSEKLWVVEALVNPEIVGQSGDSRVSAPSQKKRPASLFEAAATAPYLSVALAGPSGAGKSSLLGTLATSMLDNGRGKSRLSLLRHRHEIATGRTSSVAQELIGYRPDQQNDDSDTILNYASDNITSWNDIHTATDVERLAFVSDLPGSSRFLKSTLRGITGWRPEFVFLCVPANSPEKLPSAGGATDLALSLWYLNVLHKLKIPVIIVVTKLDIAAKQSFKQTLSILLSAIKQDRRKPIMLPLEANEEEIDLHKLCAQDKSSLSSTIEAFKNDALGNVPLLLTSSVTGVGIRRLHAFLRLLPVASSPPITKPNLLESLPSQIFDVLDVFEVPAVKVFSSTEESPKRNERSVIICGRVRRGVLSVGQVFHIGPISVDVEADDHTITNDRPYSPKTHCVRQTRWLPVRIMSARNLRLPVESLQDGQIGTIGIEPLDDTYSASRIRKGMVLVERPPPIQGDNKSTSCSAFSASIPVENADDALNSMLAPGANVVVYINNVRAAAKVSDDISHPKSQFVKNSGMVTLSFSFLASSEWVEPGSTVVIMPGNIKSTSLPCNNQKSSALPVFIGTVLDVHPG